MIQETVFKEDLIKRRVEGNLDYAASFLTLYEARFSKAKDMDKTDATLKKGMNATWLSDRITVVKKALGKT